MGFLDNIKNTFKRIFTPKRYAEEQETKKRKLKEEQELKIQKEEEKQIKIPEQAKVPNIIKPESRQEVQTENLLEEEEQEEETIPEDIPDEDRLEPYKKNNISIEGVGTINVGKTINEAKKSASALYTSESVGKVNERINEALKTELGEVKFESMYDGADYTTVMRDAILKNTNITMDDKLAEVILKHSEVFQDRFDTTVYIYTGGNLQTPLFSIEYYGALPQNVVEDVKEVTSQMKEIDPSDLWRTLNELRNGILNMGHAKGASEPRKHRNLDKSESIDKIDFTTRFR